MKKRNGPAARAKARAFYRRRKTVKATKASPFFSQTPDRPGFWTMLFGKLTKGKGK